MASGKGYLLDLIAKRYPGTRPSDLYGRKSEDNPDGLDEVQAFELDAALAYRYNSIEQDDLHKELHNIRESIKLTGRYHGIKKIKYRKYKSNVSQNVRTMTEDELEAKEKVAEDSLIKLTKGTVIDDGTVFRSSI